MRAAETELRPAAGRDQPRQASEAGSQAARARGSGRPPPGGARGQGPRPTPLPPPWTRTRRRRTLRRRRSPRRMLAQEDSHGRQAAHGRPANYVASMCSTRTARAAPTARSRARSWAAWTATTRRASSEEQDRKIAEQSGRPQRGISAVKPFRREGEGRPRQGAVAAAVPSMGGTGAGRHAGCGRQKGRWIAPPALVNSRRDRRAGPDPPGPAGRAITPALERYPFALAHGHRSRSLMRRANSLGSGKSP